MPSEIVRGLLVVGALSTFPAIGHAQDASLSGTVTDTTGAVVLGVTVTAVNEASGNTFEAVTDERGNTSASRPRKPIRPPPRASWGVVNAYQSEGWSNFSSVGNGVHKAHESPVAGLGHVYAFGL